MPTLPSSQSPLPPPPPPLLLLLRRRDRRESASNKCESSSSSSSSNNSKCMRGRAPLVLETRTMTTTGLIDFNVFVSGTRARIGAHTDSHSDSDSDCDLDSDCKHKLIK
ncbi:hypothetical protein AWZ03_010102 [Drosophila navojoa]|uniref:Uncharacterized protein n=1 Tax=Drosophila navojoa TaxID=7232 RepID=A0A484B5Z4_DRONA|nr:hypothetical protein AWZ03_010102 [Drosophila navojoa]